MTADRDDDALSWAGDDDPTLVTEAHAATGPQRPKSEPALAAGWRVVGRPGREAADGETAGDGTAAVDSEPAQLSSIALVLHGIVGGIFLLYAIGWLVAIGRDPFIPADLVGQFMYRLGQWLAVLAAPLWFGAALWVTRGAGSVRRRLIAFAIGVVVLAPWPFILGAG